MAKGIGIQGAIKSIKSANGTAQYLLFAWWTIVFSGMLVGMHTNTYSTIALALSGALVYYATVFECRKTIMRSILLSVFLTVGIAANFIYNCHLDHGKGYFDIRHTMYLVAFITIFNHGMYLAHLLTRQILEAKRILGDNPCR